ncbi:MAG: LPS export ABC transporter periplasmic protein LptC [Pseudomonadaceae bacterium]|nr:MAG: LPS export ABC transporter periplasmic protein LptC [Pseudomonadaceae bacterium]
MILRIPRYLITGVVGGLILALALAVGYWNIRPASFIADPLITEPDQPDFIIGPAWTIMRNDNGEPSYRLTSVRTTHNVNTGQSRLSQPELMLFRPQPEPPWEVQAASALVSANGDQVELTDDVVIEQTLPGGQQRRLLTDALTLHPQRDYAETAEDVRIEYEMGVTTARGMQIFLNDSRIELLSTVRGRHEVD